jgi:uncharacterized membrane protein YesL
MKQFAKVISYIGDLVILNLLFLLTVGLTAGLGIGVAFTALHASLFDLKTDEEGYYVKNYFKHLKDDFKGSFVAGLVLLASLAISYLSILISAQIPDDVLKIVFFSLTCLIELEIIMTMSFFFPIVAKFQGDWTHHLYLAFWQANRYFYLSIFFAALFVGGIFLCVYVGYYFAFFIFGAGAYLQNLILKQLWKDCIYEIPQSSF